MSNKLVAYFSASGVTEALAKRLAGAIDADLYEIKPETPYTKEDLDWMDKKSRSTVEMNDRTFRPPVSGKVENMDQYDIIFLGFPIWWYTAPTIINTFLEQYDLSGKTIVPFVSSGGSGYGSSNRDIEGSCPGADLKEGKRFSSVAEADELRNWAGKYL